MKHCDPEMPFLLPVQSLERQDMETVDRLPRASTLRHLRNQIDLLRDERTVRLNNELNRLMLINRTDRITALDEPRHRMDAALVRLQTQIRSSELHETLMINTRQEDEI